MQNISLCIILFEIFHFGEDSYFGNCDGLTWKILSAIISVAAIIATSYISFRIYNKQHLDTVSHYEKQRGDTLSLYEQQRKDAELVESNRLKDVRMMLYYLLQHWKNAMDAQINVLTTVSKDIREDLEKDFPKCAPFEVSILLDISPYRINEIRSEEIFKILVTDKQNNKTDRQKTLTRFVNQMSWAIKIEEQLEKYAASISDGYTKLLDEFRMLIRQIQVGLQEKHHAYEIAKAADQQKNEYIEGLFQIMVESYKNLPETVEGYMQIMINPLKTYLLNSKNYLEDDSRYYLNLCQQVGTLYKNSKMDKQTTLANFKNWIADLKKITETVEEIFRIEFAVELKNSELTISPTLPNP